MSQPDTKSITRGEFTRHRLAEPRPWTKQTHTGPAVDGPVTWREDKQASKWLQGQSAQQLTAARCRGLCEEWSARLTEPLRRLGGGEGKAQIILHEDCLECRVPLSPPHVAPEALRQWVAAVNTHTHLIALDEACTKASIFLPLLPPTAADVELVDAALRYIAVELRPILEVLRSRPGLAANWEQWLRTSQPEGKEETS